jgi:hypothetical protein
MKCLEIDDILNTWRRKLGFNDYWITQLIIEAFIGDYTERDISWDVDYDSINAFASIRIQLVQMINDDIGDGLNYEYIIVNSLLQIGFDGSEYDDAKINELTDELLNGRNVKHIHFTNPYVPLGA